MTDADHALALEEIDGLINATSESDLARLDALATLVDAYEHKRWPLDTELDPVELIELAMTSDVGHTRQDLTRLIGSASRVSEILNRKRPLTLDMIRKISAAWGIPISLLTPAYRLERDVVGA